MWSELRLAANSDKWQMGAKSSFSQLQNANCSDPDQLPSPIW